MYGRSVGLAQRHKIINKITLPGGPRSRGRRTHAAYGNQALRVRYRWVGMRGCEVRLCDPCAHVSPCVPCASRLPTLYPAVIVNVKKRSHRCVAAFAPAKKVRCDTRNLRDEARIRRARDAHRRRRRVRCGVRGLTPERHLQWRLIKPLNTTVAPTPRRVQFLLCRSSVSRV